MNHYVVALAVALAVDPAATLRPDEFDAPAPQAVQEAAKSAPQAPAAMPAAAEHQHHQPPPTPPPAPAPQHQHHPPEKKP